MFSAVGLGLGLGLGFRLGLGLGSGLGLGLESYDAVLAPVVGRQVLRRGRVSIVKLGDKEVDYSAG